MHARGHAHRDIKPSNIMLDDNDLPILIDFGFVDHSNIKTGTRSYFAPEQAKLSSLKNIDMKKFDVWSLGQVLYECMDGTKNLYLKDQYNKKLMHDKEKHNIKL